MSGGSPVKSRFTDSVVLHFEVWEDSDGLFVGRCLELDVYSQGDSLEEAKRATESAARLTLTGTARRVRELGKVTK